MSTIDWSELPLDVLGYLTSFLPLPDYHRFGAVCKNWSIVVRERHHRPAQQLPWYILGEESSTGKRVFLNLAENKHYYMDIPELHEHFVCGSSFGWLFGVDIHMNIRMVEPFSRKSYNLPPLDFSPAILNDPDHNWEVLKAISDHDPSERSDFTVMVVGYNYRVAFWRSGDPTWTIPYKSYGAINDVIFFKGKFYAVGYVCSDQIFVVDVGLGPDAELISLDHQVPMLPNTYKYLAEFKGELLVLQRQKESGRASGRASRRANDEWPCPHMETTNIVVHKLDLDLEEKSCSECEHLDNHALFVGNNSAVIIDPKRVPGSGCIKNSIYYTHTPSDIGRCCGNDLGIYDMVQKKMARYYSPEALFSSESSFTYLFVFPTWLASN
ncbi:F-box family protein [Rhynchospora pubera]|uniref:F-box family protein n=1 Tax=Rhynchospora pubera TaxID=906938 RepID=A0AAV8GFY9_9POAL|nr:F-box family protein [Rhynchospora pubera]